MKMLLYLEPFRFHKVCMLLYITILSGQIRNQNLFSDMAEVDASIRKYNLNHHRFSTRYITKKYAAENKKISDKLSDRSYNVMVQKWDLERKHLSISQQNQEILDSLHYAKNIQSAIMPHADSIDKIFSMMVCFVYAKGYCEWRFYFP
ncbi:MAG: hypothetical protein IPF75_15520 [Bacteroidetes bacterium]|nr:hypothetical protein [Bacteroidota bacterium]